MTKSGHPFLSGIAAFAFALAANAAHPTNPVFAENFPDPTVWQSPDGTWFAASTSQKILKSRDFFHWEDTGKRMFSDEEYGRIHNDWRQVWAPDAFRLGDEWLMYVALYNSAADSAIAVYSATNACGPFTDGRIVTRSRDTGIKDTIDPEVVRDDRDGKHWLFFGSTGKMYRVKLSDDGKAVAPGAAYEHVAGLDSSTVSGRSKVFEGACLKLRGGWWYLFASRGWYKDHTYAVVVGRARTLDGPFLDREGRRMTDGFASTVVESQEGDRFFGPGHNGEITTINGRDYMPHHCHVADDNPSARPFFVSELVWDEDGWPTADLYRRPASSELGWMDESFLTTGQTGTWAPSLAWNGVSWTADLCGECVFAPFSPSGGNVTTLDVTVAFDAVPEEVKTPTAGVQGAVWLGTNGCFQVWSLGGWEDVAADGVTPATGVDYTFRFKFDYRFGVYSVAVSDGGVMKPLVAASGTPLPAGTARFPLVERKSGISSVKFSGGGVLTSLIGEYSKKNWFNVIVR